MPPPFSSYSSSHERLLNHVWAIFTNLRATRFCSMYRLYASSPSLIVSKDTPSLRALAKDSFAFTLPCFRPVGYNSHRILNSLSISVLGIDLFFAVFLSPDGSELSRAALAAQLLSSLDVIFVVFPVVFFVIVVKVS